MYGLCYIVLYIPTITITIAIAIPIKNTSSIIVDALFHSGGRQNTTYYNDII